MGGARALPTILRRMRLLTPFGKKTSISFMPSTSPQIRRLRLPQAVPR